ncbi:ABC transporter ATP-binding protein [Collinsella aerofaciens]|uniref:ABC transporter ATP-binding protein n=1 Tax=Collinsella aerofaciens TaxID=74426 RepID=UPI0034A1CF98
MKQGMQGFVDAFNTRAPRASGTDLSPEQQNDAELARYANAALAAQTDAAFLDSAESYYALMGEGFQSGSIVGDRETNDAALAYCRALSSSGITDIPASANDLPFLSFLPYAIAAAPSFLPFIPFLLSSILVLGATRPGTLAAKAPVPKFRRLIQTVFSIIVAGTAMLLAGLAPGGIYALVLNGFGQIGYPIAFFHDGALTTTTAGNVFTALLLALLAGGTLISVCSAVLSTATRRVLAGPLTSALLAVALAYVAVFFAVGAVATRSPKQPGPAKKHHGLELLDASVGYGSTTILSIGSLSLGPGTAAGLVAPNGSGKTTLLEALSGQFPTRIRSGSLAADGICQRRSAEFAELVYLSSSGGADLYPTLSAREHLSFVREAWKSAADIDSLCDSLGISPYLDKPTRKLSTGMKQQVKLAMAIATGCPYLILDEPLNGLDPGKRKTSCDAMRSEAARGRSVLISSHLLDDLADLTDSFYFIEAGALVEKTESSSQTLKQEYLDTYEGGE